MLKREDVEKSFAQYRSQYPNDDYKPKGKRIWHKYHIYSEGFWAVLGWDKKWYPLKYIYLLSNNKGYTCTSDFHTYEAKREIGNLGLRTGKI